MSPWCECYITSPFMEMNRLETGVTHAEEVGDKGLLGCSVTEMWSLNCTFFSSLPTFFFSHPKTSENKIQEFGTLLVYQLCQYIQPQQFSIHSDSLFCSRIFGWGLFMYKSSLLWKHIFGLINFLMYAEGPGSSLKCSLLFLDWRNSKISYKLCFLCIYSKISLPILLYQTAA